MADLSTRSRSSGSFVWKLLFVALLGIVVYHYSGSPRPDDIQHFQEVPLDQLLERPAAYHLDTVVIVKCRLVKGNYVLWRGIYHLETLDGARRHRVFSSNLLDITYGSRVQMLCVVKVLFDNEKRSVLHIREIATVSVDVPKPQRPAKRKYSTAKAG